MRRKPSSNNGGGYNNNQQRRPRFPGQGDGQQRSQNNGHNRPRKNYAANREKYLAQARDALAQGDRVLAENYFQHADHCYRMMVEEGFNNPRPQHQSQPQQGEQGHEQQEQAHDGNTGHTEEEQAPENTNVLPAFLTVPFSHGVPAPAEPPPAQNWEERDA